MIKAFEGIIEKQLNFKFIFLKGDNAFNRGKTFCAYTNRLVSPKTSILRSLKNIQPLNVVAK